MSVAPEPIRPEPIRLPAGQNTGEAPLPPEAALSAADGPSAGDVADASNGSLAARLQAKLAEIQQGTEQFDVPGWDGDLVLVAKVIRDRKQIAAGLKNEQLILEATEKVLYRDEDGGLADIGGWQGVGEAMGLTGFTLGQVVRAVLDNPLRLDAFAEKLVSWMIGRRSAIEAVLGE